MDLDAAIDWEAPPGWKTLTVIDSHAGGEPFRVVVGGGPLLDGATMVERRRNAMKQHDRLRRALMWEPRGHADMYGAFVGPPVEPASDLSVLFIHNEGFSTMCGHGIIALTKVVLDTGILPEQEPETTIRIDTPAGRVEATARSEAGEVKEVAFRNVPSFVVDLDNQVEVEGVGPVIYDLAFGGAFYAYVDAEPLGLALYPSDSSKLIETGRAIKKAVMASRSIPHPLEPELGFLYGVIFVGPAQARNHSRNVCIFADGEVDRSPTGTGVSGRLAIHHARGELCIGEMITVESIVGSIFTGRIVEEMEFGGHRAVVPEIGGTAHITGRSELWVDPDDRLGEGFFLR